MKKLTLILLASAALALPGVGTALAQNDQNQQPQAQQQQPANQQPENSTQTNQPQPNQQASNQPIQPQQLSRSGVRQIQQALAKKGFHTGRADGFWGPRTSSALRSFQQAKNIQGNGEINQQTLSQLGVNVASLQTPGNSNNNPPPNQNQNQ
jgi:peptidoglycan hydrolase-like protein with peptidoglycan-binding domain